jgi:hypothetical protein
MMPSGPRTAINSLCVSKDMAAKLREKEDIDNMTQESKG